MFSDRLRLAAEAGVLIGVKWAIAAAILLFSVSCLLGDYNLVRERAANGEKAWELIQSQLNRSQTPPK